MWDCTPVMEVYINSSCNAEIVQQDECCPISALQLLVLCTLVDITKQPTCLLRITHKLVFVNTCGLIVITTRALRHTTRPLALSRARDFCAGNYGSRRIWACAQFHGECVCVFASQLAIKKRLLAQHQSSYMLVV